MAPPAPLVLVVDDSRLYRLALKALLQRNGYRVACAASAEEALAYMESDAERPELVLLDVVMPGMDGYALCRTLKARPEWAEIPVIFLTSRTGVEDLVKGFEAGGADYVAKPFKEPEILARVSTHVRFYRTLAERDRLRQLALDANPLTRLPGNNTIARRVGEALESGEDLVVIYADLDNFKAYNDVYGFSAGDAVIRFAAETLQRVAEKVAPGRHFVGHVGGDDFVVLLPASRAERFGQEVARAFDAQAPAFYEEPDRSRGYIETKDRRGRPARFPLVAISMAGVRLRQRPFRHYLEVAEACAEVKKLAKRLPGSSFVMDRRASPPGPPREPVASRPAAGGR